MAVRRIQRQYGALPFRWTEAGHIELLMITSRDTGRWVIPKGWPMKGRKPFAAAAQEAWEEAGVTGKVAKKPLGRFRYDKLLPDGTALPCNVNVFALSVEFMDSAWPEFGQRRRRWVKPVEASQLVNEKGLAKLILAFGVAALEAKGKHSRRPKDSRMA